MRTEKLNTEEEVKLTKQTKRTNQKQIEKNWGRVQVETNQEIENSCGRKQTEEKT